MWAAGVASMHVAYGAPCRQLLHHPCDTSVGWVGQVRGVRTFFGITFRCQAAVITTGTFMNGRIWVGRQSMAAGRCLPPRPPPSRPCMRAVPSQPCTVRNTSLPGSFRQEYQHKN